MEIVKTVSLIVIGIVFILFSILGIFMLRGKGSNFIPGFRRLSREEQQKYRIKSLTKFMGWIMILQALLLILLITGIWFKNGVLIILYVMFVISSLIYAASTTNSESYKK